MNNKKKDKKCQLEENKTQLFNQRGSIEYKKRKTTKVIPRKEMV